MQPDERWEQIVALDDELLKGGVILSEWCSLIVREADLAFVYGANLACILTAVSGIETYLRSEYSTKKGELLIDLIERASIDVNLKKDLHSLRRYRNRWVHIDEPWEDESILNWPQEMELELEKMAILATRLLRRTIYANPQI